jgi:predicted metal-binding membrane protein
VAIADDPPSVTPVVGSRAERVVRRDRVVVLAALAAVTGVAWLYILQMGHTPVRSMLPQRMEPRIVLSCCGVDFWTTFLMWAVMMVGMMVPSVAPMLLAFAGINRKRARSGGPYVPTAVFLCGYLVIWTAFSALAALVQWALFRASLLNAHSQRVGPWLAGALLFVAGAFQLTSVKRACLARCRSPLGFFVGEWRDGWSGALRMGTVHGAFCLGCCWLLMALLFVVGVMNLVWVAGIAAYVLAEKVLPWGRGVARIGAASCFLGGVVLIANAAWLR